MTDEPLTEAQISQAWSMIHDRADDLVTRGRDVHLWPVAKNSPLWEDDRRTDPWRPSHAASAAMSSALDHLHALSFSVTREPRVLHARAPFTLARGCIENAATALWIVHAPRRSDRIIRGLRWYATNAIDGDRAATDAGIPMPRPIKERLADLRDTAARNGCDPKSATRQLSSTAIMQYADPLIQQGPGGPLFMWRLCSGFAHGRPWASLGLLDNEEHMTDEPNVRHLRQTSSLDRVLSPALAGLNLLNLAIRTYESRATNHR